MSDRVIEKTFIMEPDSLRQFLKMNKKLYDLHTNKNYGLDDTGGIKYAGTVENFGSEILIESNKLRLKKPPIQSLNISSVLGFYFNLQFYEELDDYTDCYVYQNLNRFYKQNLVCGLLQSSRLINGYSYSIIYNDIELVFHLGSESTSDDNVKRMAFFKTTVPPVLRVVDNDNNTIDTNLTIDDGSGVDTIYYFPINLMTIDLLDMRYPDNNVINQIVSNGTFTININNHMHANTPYVWFCVDRFRHLPDFVLNNNSGYSNRTLLTPGMDGHGVMHLYPSAGLHPCVPTAVTQEGYTWWLKVYGDFSYDMSTASRRITSGEVKYIEYLYDSVVNPTDEPLEIFRKIITYDDTFCKVSLNMNHNIAWSFRYPQEGEYDYNPENEIPIGYAYAPLFTFDRNETTISSAIINNNKVLLPGFDVNFDDRKYIDYFEQKMNREVSGIHVDYTTDYSENGINKIRGIIHGLGKFDGLPKYYNEWDCETHRPHVELYSIRDSIFNNNNPMNRQTSGLIIDAGVPQNDIKGIGKGSSVSISYIDNGIFDTIRESESPVNWLTDLGYHGDNIFTWTGDIKYINDAKFIYHNNGVFSLGVQGFDPELEIGRVFAITNDPITYENNELVSDSKPATTLARICDIPTSFVQLINIKNVSPTYALDPYYTRMNACWDAEQEELLWNKRTPTFVEYDNKRVFDVHDNLDAIISSEYMVEHYSIMTNFNRYLDMTHPDQATYETNYSFGLSNPGTGYEDNDEFNVIIGGINFRGVYHTATSSSWVTMNARESETLMNIGNIPSADSYWKITAVTGNGVDAIVRLSINPIVWEDLHIKRDGINPDVYALKLDNLNRIWAWKFNGSNWIQDHLLTGEEYVFNYYFNEIGEHYPPHSLTTKNVMLYNQFLPAFNNFQPLPSPRRNDFYNAIDSSLDITSDLSSHLLNLDETFYIIYDDTEVNHNVAEYRLNRSSEESQYYMDRKLLPEFHTINSFYAYEPVCKLTCNTMYTDDLVKQPDVFVYNPFKNVKYDSNEYVCNELFISNKLDYTLKDVLDEEWFAGNYLTRNLYGKKYSNDVMVYNRQREYYMTWNRSNLLDYIQNINTNADPILFEGSESEYTKDMLVDYIMERIYPSYRSNVMMIAQQGTDYTTIHDIGGYNSIQERSYDKCRTSGGTVTSYPSNIYKIDFINDISELNDFRMYDDLGNDISRYCIIMINNTLYVFNQNKWIQIKTKGV